LMLGETVDTVRQRFGRKAFRISRPEKAEEIFKHIYKIPCSLKIPFEIIFYDDEKHVAVCFYHDKVVAIIGFDNQCNTIDSVHLKNGINEFIYYYGNKNLEQLNSGNHALYLYPTRGIAVADDDLDDSIDSYLVFTPINQG
jgi:hypothetical protein